MKFNTELRIHFKHHFLMESLNRPVTQVLQKIMPNYFNYESLQFNFFFLRSYFPFKQMDAHYCFINGRRSSNINDIYIIPLCSSLSNKEKTSVKIKVTGCFVSKKVKIIFYITYCQKINRS